MFFFLSLSISDLINLLLLFYLLSHFDCLNNALTVAPSTNISVSTRQRMTTDI